MDNLKIYKNSHLKRLSGSFRIYMNSDNKFLHISEKSDIKVDLGYWKYIETVKI